MTGDVNLTHIRHALLFIYEGANESVERDALAQLAAAESVIQAARVVDDMSAVAPMDRDALNDVWAACEALHAKLAALGDGQ